MVHLARVARLDHQRAARACAFAHEMVVHARRREQARDRSVRGAHAAIRQDQDRVARLHGIARALAKVRHRALEPGPVVGGIEQHRQGDGAEPLVLEVPQLRRLLVADDGVLDFDLPARLGPRIEQVALGPDRRLHRRHQLLADGVERRVRHLREELLEIVVEQPRPVREHGQRRVGAHRADRLLGVERHRRRGSGAGPRACTRTPAAAAARSRDPAPAGTARPADRRCRSGAHAATRRTAVPPPAPA